MNPDDLSARPFDVIGLGTNTLDLIAVIDGYPEPDTKVQFQELDIQGGGVVATAMATCARLGLRTRYVGKVGGDFWGRLALRALADRGPSRVAVTLAEQGALGYENGQRVRAPGFRVQVVDSNGAGDVFHGACVFGELRGWPFGWVLTFASAVAAMKCRSIGGRRGIPRLPEAQEFLQAHGHWDIAQGLA